MPWFLCKLIKSEMFYLKTVQQNKYDNKTQKVFKKPV